MEPIYFGDKKEIFGFFHPSTDGSTDRSVLICPPLFIEFFRAYQVLKEVASELARSGYNVLRFDYRGTGDSGLYQEDTRPEDWIVDIRAGAAELVDILGTTRTTVLSCRASALMAAEACRDLEGINALVCIDPLPTGDAYISDLVKKHNDYQSSYERAFRVTPDYAEHEVLGFQLNPNTITDIRNLPNHIESAPGPLVLLTQDQSTDLSVPTRKIDADCEWPTIRAGKMLFGRALIDGIVAGVREAADAR